MKVNRREALKGLVTAPLAGAFFVTAGCRPDKATSQPDELSGLPDLQGVPAPTIGSVAGDPVRVGIIGYGRRGSNLCSSLGFASPRWLEVARQAVKANPAHRQLRQYTEQENLNVLLTAASDVFEPRSQEAVAAGRLNGVKTTGYREYRALFDDADVDAVIIATPDHLHAPIAIAAIEAGKHVYLEKCMTHKIGETYALYEAAKSSNVVFQVGHQNRQTQSFYAAKEIIRRRMLGHVSLIQTTTNRNSSDGAWQYPIPTEAAPSTIDWQAFRGSAPDVPFNAEHFFRWRKWWEYGTGLSGDLLTHEFDRINFLLGIGIPRYCVASGGIYSHRDGRDVPDVFQVSMEYPEFSTGSSRDPGLEMGMTLSYSATLGNGHDRGTLLMGHDGTMQLDRKLIVEDDAKSPLFVFDPGDEVDAFTGATSKYFADKGLTSTYRDGRWFDPTYLHLREWLSGIRHGTDVSCGIGPGFDESMAAHMATLSYRLGRRIKWDAAARRLANVSEDELEALGMA